MTRQDFLAAMAPLAVNYRRELTAPLLRLFWSEFQHVRPVDFQEAVQGHLREGQFFPTVAELRQRLGLPRSAPTLTEAATVFEALLTDAPAYDARRGDYWPMREVFERFGPIALAAFLRAGGTRAFRDRTERNVDFLRRDFLAGWDDACTHPVPVEYLLPPGLAVARGLAPLSDSLPRLMPGEPEPT